MNKAHFVASAIISLSSLSAAAATFFTYSYLARNLDIESFGKFSAILVVLTFLSLLSTFGISPLRLNKFGKSTRSGKSWIKASENILILSSSISIIFFFSYLFTIEEKEYGFLLLAIHLIGQITIDITNSTLQIQRNFLKLSILGMTPNIARLVFIFIIYQLLGTISLKTVCSIYAFVAIATIIYCSYEIKKFKSSIKNILVPNKTNGDVLKKAWPYMLGAIFSFIYMQSDIVMLQHILGEEAAGLYNVAFIFFSAAILLPNALYQKYLMPKIHIWAHHDIDTLKKASLNGYKIMLIIGLSISIFILIYSDMIISLCFGAIYINSADTLKIISIAIPFYLISYSAGAVLSTKEFMKLKVAAMGLIAVLNVVLNLYLIPKFNIEGAALATLISYILLFILYLILVHLVAFKPSKKQEAL